MTEQSPQSLAERGLERALFASRWLMAPFYVGLVVALAVLLVVFCRELIAEVGHLTTMTADDAILMALSLIDLSLAGNLLLIVTYSGYENFISRINDARDGDRPDWMGAVGFSELKMKLIASIVAISAIALLKAFMAMDEAPVDGVRLGWMIGIHLTFVVSGVLLALMDFLKARAKD